MSPVLLYVEDSEDEVFAVRRALGRYDSPVELAHAVDGQAALDWLEDALSRGAPLPHLILLDLNMPGMNGPALLSELRERPALDQVPVVVWTSSSEKAEVRATARLGARAYHVKPESPKAFARRLHAVLDYWLHAVEVA